MTQLLLSEVIFSDRSSWDEGEQHLKKATHFTYAKITQQQRLPNWTNCGPQPQKVTSKLYKKGSVPTIPPSLSPTPKELLWGKE